ncbi:MAG: hypothetical protein GAK43_02026 [Stenotrophomonas maltophilia]|nr:MAG: hypothetical protein GAK43_02026 [Stenotrophomonas maltophilia]
MTSRRKTVLALILVLLCGLALLWAYQWFQRQYIRPFSSQPTLFSGEHLAWPEGLGTPGEIRLVHFWDPACPCNVGNQQHLAELMARFATRGVHFYAVQKPGSHGQLPTNLTGLTALPSLPGSEQLPASPAVAIWDRDGRLAYVGPYSEGAVCSSSNSFIEPVIEALLAGRPVNATHNLALGCYCPWSDSGRPAPG